MRVGALFLLSLLFINPAKAQVPPSQCITSAVAGGTSDAITLPLIPCWPASTLLILTATLSNVTSVPTLSINGGIAYTIQTYSRQPLGVGYFIPGGTYLLVFNGSNWQLLNPPYIPPSGTVAGPATSTIGDAACWANTNGSLLNDCGLLGSLAHQNSNNVSITGGNIASTTLSGDILSGTTTNNGTISGGTIASANISGSNFSNGALLGNSTNAGTITGGTYASATLSSPLIQNGTLNTSTFNSGTLNSSAINTPTITGGTATNFAVQSVPRTQTLSNAYTIQPSDCGANIALGGGIYTVTFPNNPNILNECPVTLYNYSTNAKIIGGQVINSLEGTNYWIWPGQRLTFSWDQSFWVSTGPLKYVYQGPELYVASSGCSDNNDGLLPTTPLCNVNVAARLAQANFTCTTGLVTINLAAGTYSNEDWAMAGPPPPGCGDQIIISGVSGSPTSVLVTCASAGDCFDVEDHFITTLEYLEIGCISATGVYSRQFAVVDLNEVEFGSCNSGSDMIADEGGHINILNPGTGIYGALIAGNANVAIEARGAGSEISATATPTQETLAITSSAISISGAFADAIQGGQLNLGPSQITGGGSVTGTEWAADSLGLIFTNGSGVPCNSFFNVAGSVGGSATNGAVCN